MAANCLNTVTPPKKMLSRSRNMGRISTVPFAAAKKDVAARHQKKPVAA